MKFFRLLWLVSCYIYKDVNRVCSEIYQIFIGVIIEVCIIREKVFGVDLYVNYDGELCILIIYYM